MQLLLVDFSLVSALLSSASHFFLSLEAGKSTGFRDVESSLGWKSDLWHWLAV